MTTTIELPQRYEPIERLGKGGGGEVWAVRERHTDDRFALKALALDATENEMAALVREAVALSGLEGLGVPRVIRFGRLPESRRPFMIRELVEGRSLEDVIEDGKDFSGLVGALASAAEQLTVLHRAGFLHGDVKPANIIVTADGSATMVDLGLAAPWQEEGTKPEGLTPKYAAPELFEGKPLTVRAEIYALGVALAEATRNASKLPRAMKKELETVAKRATSESPTDRYPSADEFAVALRRAAKLSKAHDDAGAAQVWPIVGIDQTAARLLEKVAALNPGGAILLDGPPESGRSALLRRLAWSLGVEGRPLAWIDEASAGDASAVGAELDSHPNLSGVAILVDDPGRLDPPSVRRIGDARKAGARIVSVGDAPFTEGASKFEVPPLDAHSCSDLVHRAIPSLTERLRQRVVDAAAGRPGRLRSSVAKIASEAIASEADLDRLLDERIDSDSLAPRDPLARAQHFLERGRFTDARSALERVEDGDPLVIAAAWARLELGLGNGRAARARLETVAEDARARTELSEGKLWKLYFARSHIALGDYETATNELAQVTEFGGAIGAEARSYLGLAHSLLGRHDQARGVLQQAIDEARACNSGRVAATALLTLAMVLQKDEVFDEARTAYDGAITSASSAGDAGLLATTQLNRAGLLKVSGDVAGAIEGFEAAVDMGRRAGRLSTVRQALLNLANTDLYLGRMARARSSIEALQDEHDELTRVARAQLKGLQAELAARSGNNDEARELYSACADEYLAMGQRVDAAEARLEGVLAELRTPNPKVDELQQQIGQARDELEGASAHRPLLLLATARASEAAGRSELAAEQLEDALRVAREGNHREWVWRTLEARAEVLSEAGQPTSARRDREEALTVLEEIGARLPRDLREVYWNDPRRRALRSSVQTQMGHAATEYAPQIRLRGPAAASASTSTSPIIPDTPLEQRLARILEINNVLAGEHDLERLTAKITDYAVTLLGAERGFVVLQEADGSLSLHTSRYLGVEDPGAEFSRSIARQVLDSGDPVVSVSPGDDSRLRNYQSVHQLMLNAVACVPVVAPGGQPMGALYVETRVASGVNFQRELPTLAAFADQMAIAIHNAQLISENRERAEQLAHANSELEEAQSRLRELLDNRTAKLNRARRKLRDAKETLEGHFGYQGLVGTSRAMRKVYALIDRVKDTDVPVLITGESGTGKEVVAKAIHQASSRKTKPFLGVNCGAIPEHLLESELFGHVKGAFTGADRDRKGLFREGEGGTLLLDEIGEMPKKMQAGLLRVLQEHRVRPVGGTREEPVDVRTIFATNRDLGQMVEDGDFREDLYYRIHVVEVALPPLRDRTEDIAPLVDHFLGIFASKYKRERGTVTRQAMRRLAAYDWPGNVRQLEHVLLNAWVLSDTPELDLDDFDLPDGYAARTAPSSGRAPRSEPTSSHRSAPKSTLSQHRKDERERILQALQTCNWNRVKAAELIGIPRRTFYRRLREYGIQ